MPMCFLTSDLKMGGRDAGLHHYLVAAGLRARHFTWTKAYWYET